MGTTVSTPVLHVPRTRRTTYAAASAGFAALAAGSTLARVAVDSGGVTHSVAVLAFGGLLVTGGLLAQAWRPERHLAAWRQVAAAFAALLLAATAVEAVDPAPLGLAAMIALLWALHPARAALLVRPRDASPPLVIVAVILTALLMPIVTGEVAAHRAGVAAAAAGQPLGVVAFARRGSGRGLRAPRQREGGGGSAR